MHSHLSTRTRRCTQELPAVSPLGLPVVVDLQEAGCGLRTGCAFCGGAESATPAAKKGSSEVTVRQHLLYEVPTKRYLRATYSGSRYWKREIVDIEAIAGRVMLFLRGLAL